MFKRLVSSIIIFTIFLIACTKEYSYERTNDEILQQTPAVGTIVDCGRAVISGEALTNVELDQSNTVQIDINVTQAGYYTITTDTINGIYFSTKGILNKTGLQTLTLQGYGKPNTVANSNFTLFFNSSQCNFNVPILTDLNTWSFWDNTRKYSGIVSRASIYALFGMSGSTQGLLLVGVNNVSNPTPLALELHVEDPISFLQPSIHYLYNNSAPTNGFLFYENNILKYRINKSTPNTFPLQITSFNRATRIIEATFEGPAIDITTSPLSFLNIRKGRFKAQFMLDPRL